MQTPRYEYSRRVIQATIDELTSLSAPFGLTVRYAVKANPHPDIISMMARSNIAFDASSSFEATELLEQGIAGEKISLSSQQSAANLQELTDAGVRYVATSLNQVKQYIGLSNRPDTVGVRINPGIGAGHNNRTSTGGVSASFGIWHEQIPDITSMCEQAGITIDRVHFHVGSGADPSMWDSVMLTCLELMEHFPDAMSIDIGGGYKVFRYGHDKEADMPGIIKAFGERLEEYATLHDRQLHLEIEPGTYMIAHAGTLIAEIDDIVSTGENGYTFLRLNTGMNDFLRSSMYGAQHTISIETDETEEHEYVVVGHNCESGDILTPLTGDPEGIEPRFLPIAKIGDIVKIHDTGAYCASMRAKGYNSFPDAIELMVD